MPSTGKWPALACLALVAASCRALPDAGAPDQAVLLEEARREWSAHRDEASAVWVGRRLAYLGRTEQAVEWYGARLADFPASYRLLRHRGHRWITLRDFARAEADLTRAWELARAHPDAVEPDGLPNARGVPTGTDRTNILYHLALAQYLQGRFDAARASWERAFRAAAEGAHGDDSEVACAYWQHLARARAAEPEAHPDLARGVAVELELLENHAYHRLCLLLTCRLAPEGLGQGPGSGLGEGIDDATLLYGLARWHAEGGRAGEARLLLERIVRDTPAAAFGHIAAEADLRRPSGGG